MFLLYHQVRKTYFPYKKRSVDEGMYPPPTLETNRLSSCELNCESVYRNRTAVACVRTITRLVLIVRRGREMYIKGYARKV